MAFDRPVTVRSNWGLAFVFNKSLWGVGSPAEGRRQKAAKIAGIAVIARHRRDRKEKSHHGGAETRRTARARDRVIGKSGDRVIGKQHLTTETRRHGEQPGPEIG